jgi:hypothetical protein
MRKYEHKILGIIGELHEDGHIHFIRKSKNVECLETIWKGFVENSNDWEEIKSEYPKIITIRRTVDAGASGFKKGYLWKVQEDGRFKAESRDNVLSIEYLLNKQHEIYQVQTSEKDIWTVGDTLTYSDKMQEFWKESPIFKIKRFKIWNNNEIVVIPDQQSYKEGNEYTFSQVKKIERFPLFITEDSVEIFKGDVY